MKTRNFVAKNDFNKASTHEDLKKKSKNSMRKQKHKVNLLKDKECD